MPESLDAGRGIRQFGCGHSQSTSLWEAHTSDTAVFDIAWHTQIAGPMFQWVVWGNCTIDGRVGRDFVADIAT